MDPVTTGRRRNESFYYYSIVAQVEGSGICTEIVRQALGTNLTCYRRGFPQHLWEDANGYFSTLFNNLAILLTSEGGY